MFVDSAFQIAIQAIRGDIKASREIWNLIEDINVFAKTFENFKFTIVDSPTNYLIRQQKRLITITLKGFIYLE